MDATSSSITRTPTSRTRGTSPAHIPTQAASPAAAARNRSTGT
ncbi:MAG TPA: hypothetical protein VGL36_33055 [Kribbella sp.]